MNVALELMGGNFARPCNYRLQMEMPALIGTSPVSNKYLDTLVKNTSIPGTEVTTRDFWIDGHVVKLPGVAKQDQTWEATFYLDDEYYARLKFEAWIQLCDKYFMRQKPSMSKVDRIATGISNLLPGKDRTITTPTNSANTSSSNWFNDALKREGFGAKTAGENGEALQAKILLTQQTYTGADLVTCTMYNVFPTKITPIRFDDADSTSVSEFTVTFSYSHHEVIAPSGIIGSMLDKYGVGV